MTRYQFAYTSAGSGREAGVVRSDSYQSALAVLDQHLTAGVGDTLEIGVPGFPPMRYEAVFTIGGGVEWTPAAMAMMPGLIAA